MKKLTKELQGKTIKELEKTVIELRQEIAKLKLQQKVNPQKDTNTLFKKKKYLAKLLTIINQKKELEILKKSK